MIEVKQIIAADDPVLKTVSKWISDWWGESQGYPPEQMEAYFKRCICHEKLPQTYVAYQTGEPVGAFQFGMSDTFVRPDVYPWLKNVYVLPELRGQGIASEMMKFAAGRIRELGISEIFLFTHLIGYYEKFGWKFMETFDTCEPEIGVQRLYRFDG